MKVLCFSVTPSPYQRDFFRALAAHPDCELTVAYFERAPDDSPWTLGRLEPWESVMPGRVFGRGRVRCHWNTGLPRVRNHERVIVNAPLTAITTQRVFHRLARRISPPWVFWGEQLLPRAGWRKSVQRLLSGAVGSADAIVAIGEEARHDYQRRFPRSRVHNIPYACDLAGFQRAARLRSPAGVCRFLFAGQMIGRKGVDVLLGAFATLVREGMEVELHLIGREGDLPGWMEALDAATRGRVVYHGFKQPETLPEAFAQADVFVLPSRHDGWGVVVNQAMGAGMPVITTTAAGAGRDLVTHGVNGLRVPGGSLAALTDAMRSLAGDPERRIAMGAASAAAAERILPAVAAAQWMQVLRECRPLGKKRAEGPRRQSSSFLKHQFPQ